MIIEILNNYINHYVRHLPSIVTSIFMEHLIIWLGRLPPLNVYTDKLEESRDAVAVANIRSAYSRAMSEYITYTANDNNYDYVLNTYVIKDGDKIVGSINYQNGRIAQISIYNVEVPTNLSNN